MLCERTGFIVWISDLKAAKGLDRFGNVHYVSKKLKYAVLYMNSDKVEENLKQLHRLAYVQKVERSYRNEIKTEYSKDVEDKTRAYSI